MTRKGGGRESGGKQDRASPVSEPGMRHEEAGNPAANPAALPDDWVICPTCGRTRDGAAGRIRELEAELERYEAAYGPTAEKLKARVKDLESLLADWRIRAANLDAEKVRLEEELSTLKLVLGARDIALQKALHARDERSSSAQRE